MMIAIVRVKERGNGKSTTTLGTLSGPKARTLRLLREAAHELLRTGGPLTVPAVAELAGVSRATAYRYFTNNDAVVLHATMSLADDPLADTDWAPRGAASPAELGARAADLVRATAAWAFVHETELRTLLRLSLEPERANVKPRRGLTNRGRWIAALLEGLPGDVEPAARDRLAAALIPFSERMPSSGPPTWPIYHAIRQPTSSCGWRKSLSRRRWQAGSSPTSVDRRVSKNHRLEDRR